MCGDVSRWAVPSVSLCACRVCVSGRSVYRISSLASRYASLFSLSNTHTTYKKRRRPALTAHRSYAHTQRGCGLAGLPSPLCAHTLTRSHTADTSRISSLGLAPPLSIRTRQTHKEAAACPHRSPLTHSYFIFHFTHFLSLCLQIQRACAQRKTGSSSLVSSIACNALGST